jgi:hypothetical protein
VSNTENDNRRRASRVERINLVQVSRFDEDGFNADLTTGRTLNLSRSGLRLELHHALPLRSHVRLDLAIGEHLVSVEGIVVYLEALPGDRCAMGVSFHQVEPEVQDLLDSVVEETAA